MTIGAVTARSHGGLVPANQNRPPRTAKIIQLRKTRVVRTRIPPSVSTRGLKHAIRNQQTRSLAKIARIVTGKALQTVARSTPLSLAAVIGINYLYQRVVEPDGFPGFDNIEQAWRSPPQAPFLSPGDWAPNPFDHSPTYNAAGGRIALLDALTCGLPLGCKYWGDFPDTSPYPNHRPAENWPTVPQWLPNPEPSPLGRPLRRYNPQRDFAQRFRPRPRWRNTNNISLRISLPGAKRLRGRVTIKFDVPRVRGAPRDDKAKPRNQFVYAVLKGLADGLGETKEWIDILAEAAGYQRGSLLVPASIRQGHETVAKAWWLFVESGINDIDFDKLAVLVIENEIEDFLIGIAGSMSKFAARSLGLTVGPQTGPAIGGTPRL